MHFVAHFTIVVIVVIIIIMTTISCVALVEHAQKQLKGGS